MMEKEEETYVDKDSSVRMYRINKKFLVLIIFIIICCAIGFLESVGAIDALFELVKTGDY